MGRKNFRKNYLKPKRIYENLLMEQGKNVVIGIHSGHNSSVALIKNGNLDFAIQEERLTRIKNQGGLPACSLSNAFNLCESEDKLHFSWVWS